MSTQNICFCVEIRKYQYLWLKKKKPYLELYQLNWPLASYTIIALNIQLLLTDLYAGFNMSIWLLGDLYKTGEE